MTSFLRPLGAFFLALLTLIILGTAVSAQYALSAIASLGADISFGTWISTTLQDIAGMAPLYGVIFGLALLLGLVGAAIAERFLALPRALIYAVAGFVAICTTFLAMTAAFYGIMPIAAARSWNGLIVQGLVGSLAAYVFVIASKRKA